MSGQLRVRLEVWNKRTPHGWRRSRFARPSRALVGTPVCLWRRRASNSALWTLITKETSSLPWQGSERGWVLSKTLSSSLSFPREQSILLRYLGKHRNCSSKLTTCLVKERRGKSKQFEFSACVRMEKSVKEATELVVTFGHGTIYKKKLCFQVLPSCVLAMAPCRPT